MKIRHIFILVIFLIGAFTFLYVENNKNNYQCKDCNVVFIGIDALQAARVGHLGYFRNTTPTLDMIARTGYSFSQAISPSSWTVPTYMSIFTATFPTRHKLTNKYIEFSDTKQTLSNINVLSPEIITIAQELKINGYLTGGFTGDAGVGSNLGYSKGFDMYTDDIRFGGFDNSLVQAQSWLDGNANKKFFMFFHGYDDHGQFSLPEGYQSRFSPKDYKGKYQGTAREQGNMREEGLKGRLSAMSESDTQFWRAWYDGKIRDADERLALFITDLKKRKIYEKTIFVIFSDHGTEFMEHDKFDHGHTLYDELIHVPLIISFPGIKQGKVISSQVSTLDILPTTLELLGLQPSVNLKKQIVGKSLIPYFKNGRDAGHDVYSETDYRDYTHKRAVRTTDGWKYILTLETMQEELFNLNSDPSETDNLINVEKDKAASLRRKLKDHLDRDLLYNSNLKMKTGCLPAYPDQCKE